VQQLPAVETWWPSLPAHLKQLVREHLSARLPAAVLDEILPHTDHINEGYNFYHLSPTDRDFIRTQSEAVD
jgi:hypothetical protein